MSHHLTRLGKHFVKIGSNCGRYTHFINMSRVSRIEIDNMRNTYTIWERDIGNKSNLSYPIGRLDKELTKVLPMIDNTTKLDSDEGF